MTRRRPAARNALSGDPKAMKTFASRPCAAEAAAPWRARARGRGGGGAAASGGRTKLNVDLGDDVRLAEQRGRGVGRTNSTLQLGIFHDLLVQPRIGIGRAAPFRARLDRLRLAARREVRRRRVAGAQPRAAAHRMAPPPRGDHSTSMFCSPPDAAAAASSAVLGAHKSRDCGCQLELRSAVNARVSPALARRHAMK